MVENKSLPNIMQNRDLLIKLIEKEKMMFKDKNSMRIVVGGIRAGGILSLATILKYCTA